jgi:hypothetical protein
MRKWKGARWWKCDLHAHTPASDDYGKGPAQTALKARTPEEWLLDYMRADIDCVAITDHNSGEWVARVQEALKGMEASKPEGFRPLCVFPGAEISVNGGVHVLAILDANRTTADVNSLLGAVGFSGTKGSSDGVTSKSFKEVVAAIASAGGLAIPAHADRDSGLFKLTGNTLLQALQCKEVVAIEIVDKSATKPAVYTEAKVRWTEILGSDSHHPSGASGQRFPGSHFTWVKMGEPSLDGLRLALRDGPLSARRYDSQSDNPNSHANLIIESIEVSNARYMGRSETFSIELNPWLNAIVGGRGTGKSSSVEFLRLALGRASELPDDLGTEFAKYAANYANREDVGLLTESTRIVATYAKDGLRFRIESEPASGKSTSIHEDRDGQWHPVEGDVTQRFPVRIFSQKQIFQLAKTPLALLGIVDDSPAVNHRKWEDRIGALANEYMTLKARIRQLSSEAAEESRLKGELDDVTRRLAVFEGSGHTDVLSQYQSSTRAQATVAAWRDSWATAGERLLRVTDDLVPDELQLTDGSAQLDGDAQLIAEAAELREQFQTARNELNALAVRADQITARWDAAVAQSDWKMRVDLAQQAYRDLVARLKDEGAGDPDAYAYLVTHRQEIETRLEAFESTRVEISKLADQASATLTALLDHRQRLTKSRGLFLDEVLNGNNFVQIKVVPYGAKDTVEDELRKLLQRERGVFEKDIGSAGGDGLIGRLYSSGNQPGDVEGGLADIKSRLREMWAGTHDSKAIGDQRFVKHVQGLPPEALDRIDLWFPEDSLAVSYSPTGDRKQFRPIAEGSPGQKTAALLAFLLSYGEEPLVLDQPEDDLDNHLIYDLIVAQLREVKRRRQVIVVTHNSNIVVNGDAELVVALGVRSGQSRKECEGCLQESAVRDSICRIMEGGRVAFEQRYRRITLESGND